MGHILLSLHHLHYRGIQRTQHLSLQVGKLLVTTPHACVIPLSGCLCRVDYPQYPLPMVQDTATAACIGLLGHVAVCVDYGFHGQRSKQMD